MEGEERCQPWNELENIYYIILDSFHIFVNIPGNNPNRGDVLFIKIIGKGFVSHSRFTIGVQFISGSRELIQSQEEKLKDSCHCTAKTVTCYDNFVIFM